LSQVTYRFRKLKHNAKLHLHLHPPLFDTNRDSEDTVEKA